MLDLQVPSESADTFALEDFLPYRLSILANRVSRALAGTYAERFGLSIPEWRVMAVLGRFPDLTSTEVAERTAMDKVRVSRAVASLLNAGRIKRTLDPLDRRRATLCLTPKGRKVHGEIVPLARRYEARLIEELSAAERAQIDRLVGRLTEIAHGLEPADLPAPDER